MTIKMVVYDFDGVIVENRWTEKLWRWLAEKIKIKTPKFLFFLQEIIEFIFNKKPKRIEETIVSIKRLDQKCYFLGILTDRSLWSLAHSLEKINLNLKNFDFIQTRESMLDCFVETRFLPLSINKLAGTKPNILMFESLKKFAQENNINNIREIMIIEDSKRMVNLARAHNFSAINIKDINYVLYI